MYDSKELIPHQTLLAIVENYQQAQREIAAGFQILNHAQDRLNQIAGEHCYLFTDKISRYSLDRAGEASMKHVKRQVWNAIVRKSQVENLLSTPRKRDLEQQIEHDKAPEITVQAVLDFLGFLAGNVDVLFKETVAETFEWLRPPRSEYKTNTELEIGERAIINYGVDSSWTWPASRLSYHKEQNFRDMDNVFHLLDGKGPVKHPDDLVTKVHTVMREKQARYEDDYFELHWYKKGSVHIRFKRLDLLARLNQIGGENRIKPPMAKAA
jgi:hypothetical protein